MALICGLDVGQLYREIHPGLTGICSVIQAYTLREIKLRPINSEIEFHQVDMSTKIGEAALKFPLLSAAMDTVTGASMAKAMSEVGGCGIIYRDKKPEIQLAMIKEALDHRFCLVSKPKSLRPGQTIEDAKDILDEFDFSTIPVVESDGKLLGVVFTRDITFKGHLHEPVERWMKPLSDLKVEKTSTSFKRIRQRLLNEQECTVLPIVSKSGKLKGLYFMLDFVNVNPSTWNGKPLVGMAIGTHESDLDRVREALKFGIGVIVIDSSHGNCSKVINQARKVVKLADGSAVVIAGNIADIEGYLLLAQAGVDGVKCGIGSGSICTTSSVTGVGFPMFTLIRELQYVRKRLISSYGKAPEIIPDGGIEGQGDLVLALAAGGHACMAGKWLVAAKESLSVENFGVHDGEVYYRGMASKAAIRARSSDRYGKQKKAEEGVEGWVPYRGPLKKWFAADVELASGGFAHLGARTISVLQEICNNAPWVFAPFSSAGQWQIATRLNCAI